MDKVKLIIGKILATPGLKQLIKAMVLIYLDELVKRSDNPLTQPAVEAIREAI